MDDFSSQAFMSISVETQTDELINDEIVGDDDGRFPVLFAPAMVLRLVTREMRDCAARVEMCLPSHQHNAHGLI
jgi:hypothetical protein